jgi:sterol desaturase/sphingolipid hydroxylase (fatty acid hydroxylase superfamily)
VVVTVILSVLGGALLWTLLEYLLHRFVFHEQVLGRGPASEHAQHHVRVSWFAPWSAKLRLAALILPVLSAAAWLAGGAAVGVPLISGTVASWLIYERLHRSIHVRAPRGPYGRWARRHHLHHHFRNPRANHGVTTPLWDRVFGTLEPCPKVTVPRRHVAKLPWLVDADGEIAARWRAEYAAR